jgi:hypothetical protein
MIPLMDDPTHIAHACARTANWNDRIAITGLNCLLGESVDASRIASLILIVLTVLILDRVFFRDRDWRRVLMIVIHPLVLTPFFWASQISTSLTTFWASAWLWLLVNRKWWLLIPFSFLVYTVRFEGGFYALVFLSIWLIQNREQSLSKKVRIGLALMFPVLFGVLFLGLKTHIFHRDSSYPENLWPVLQVDALFRYGESLILPWRASFMGDWYRWMTIAAHPEKTIILFLLSALTWVGALIFWIRTSIRKGAHAELPKRLLMSTLYFFGCTFAISILPRSDWYYLIRTYLGVLCWWIWMAPMILKNRLVYAVVMLVLVLSAMSHVFGHYASESGFRIYEQEVTGADHPFLDLVEAKSLTDEGKSDQAIRVLHSAYSKIPLEYASKSPRTGALWSQVLYEAWYLYEVTSDSVMSAKIYRLLQKSTFFPAVHACLQVEQKNPQQCLEGIRRASFCSSFGHEFPRLKTVRGYLLSVKDVCGFDPGP